MLLSWDLESSIMVGFLQHGSAMTLERFTANMRKFGRHIRNPLILPILLYQQHLANFSVNLLDAESRIGAAQLKVGWLEPYQFFNGPYPIPPDYDAAHNHLALAHVNCNSYNHGLCTSLDQELEAAFQKLAAWLEDTENSGLAVELFDLRNVFNYLHGQHYKLEWWRAKAVDIVDLRLKIVGFPSSGSNSIKNQYANNFYSSITRCSNKIAA